MILRFVAYRKLLKWLYFIQASARTVAETVDLLLQLKEPEEELYEQYLSKYAVEL